MVENQSTGTITGSTATFHKSHITNTDSNLGLCAERLVTDRFSHSRVIRDYNNLNYI
jgi:hypothetical protein